MKYRYVVVLVGVLMVAMGMARSVLADIGPSPPPSGASIETDNASTMVQMVSEDVLMTIVDDFAYVKATFDMRNMGTEEETVKVRFPMNVTVRPTEERIENFSAYVDGKAVEVALEEQPYPGGEDCEDCLKEPWSTWHVTFPPGQLVKIGVMYQVRPIRLGGMVTYTYVIATGAGWYGPIGEGTITFRLPYELDEHNVWLEKNEPTHPSPAYYTISGADIIWHFTDLEPTWEDGIMQATVMRPPEWRELQAAQKEVDGNLDSVSARLRLARALRNSLAYDNLADMALRFESNLERADRAAHEYEYVLGEMPDTVDYHVEYTVLLFWYLRDYGRLRPALERALELAPYDDDLLEIERVADLWAPAASKATATVGLTQTPYPTSTPRLTRTPTTTLTPMLASTPTPMLTSPPNPSPPIGLWVAIGTVVVMGGVGIGVGVYRKRQAA